MFRATSSPILRSTFLTLYTAFGTMHRDCCRSVPRLRWNFRLLIFLNQPYIFRATNSVILRSTFLTLYTVFGTMHRDCCPIGATVEMELSFINLFKSALHVSGDKFAHPQEHFFDSIYSFRYNASTLLPTGATVEMERQFYINRGTKFKKSL